MKKRKFKSPSMEEIEEIRSLIMEAEMGEEDALYYLRGFSRYVLKSCGPETIINIAKTIADSADRMSKEENWTPVKGK